PKCRRALAPLSQVPDLRQPAPPPLLRQLAPPPAIADEHGGLHHAQVQMRAQIRAGLAQQSDLFHAMGVCARGNREFSHAEEESDGSGGAEEASVPGHV
ncbi:unnamed protein product, partial [Urochloa humidicola]